VPFSFFSSIAFTIAIVKAFLGLCALSGIFNCGSGCFRAALSLRYAPSQDAHQALHILQPLVFGNQLQQTEKLLLSIKLVVIQIFCTVNRSSICNFKCLNNHKTVLNKLAFETATPFYFIFELHYAKNYSFYDA
jgi:hypothetical protein